MQISVDGLQVFDGDIDKGCGNQVFDYCKTIVVTPISATPRGARAPAGSIHSRVKTKHSLLSPTPAMDNVDLLSDHSEEPSPCHTLEMSPQERALKKKQVGNITNIYKLNSNALAY